jgi:hypothetical protein
LKGGEFVFFLGIIGFLIGSSVLIIIFCFLLGYVIIPLWNKINEKNGKQPKVEIFMQDNGILPSKIDRFFDGKYLIHDKRTKLLWLYNSKKNKAIRTYSNSVLGCELKIDDETEYRSSLISTTGRAIVGGLLFGGIGAVVGGGTAKKSATQLVHSVILTIFYDIDEHPYEEIEVFSDYQGSNITDRYFQDKYNTAIYWTKFIENYSRR